MNQLAHIQKNKKNLELRSLITQQIRAFFWSENFLEVETPNFVKLAGQEPYLSPIKLNIHNEKKGIYSGFLHTSPEYTMKKMLAAGFKNIFSICKCYRDYESFGGTHNPEFTMLEWYRTGVDMFAIMDDVKNLLIYLSNEIKKTRNQESVPNLDSIFSTPDFLNLQKISMKELWKKHVGVNLDTLLTTKKLAEFCAKKYNTQATDFETYEDLFYKVFLNEIEPKLIEPTIVYNYPAQMAALAKIYNKDPKYAERFEVYINGLEIANAFTELTNSTEQKIRLEAEHKHRASLNKDVYDIDEDFLEAVSFMPDSAGIALGVDRLVQVLLGCQNIDDVLVLPASKLFES